ncbi:MAG: DUF1329 domain-containing protein [bacterium]|nr:DUF1329 domain-containing protein [Gammaproteobacteria bacterium]HIL84370.1 DUF1329 domain-containing protein [Pseudomonadales bacterium]
MRIKRYDRNYSRRKFMQQAAAGFVTTGVLMPLWPEIARSGDISAVYPDELLSIESYTNGRLSNGDVIDADNVDLVKDLLDPIKYIQISQMGRKLTLKATTTDIMKLNPWDYIEATLRHQGQARFDDTGNVVTKKGNPWIGGNPFPDANSAVEIFANATLSWGRHDVSFYAIKEVDLNPKGSVAYKYDACWVEYAPVGRITLDPKPYDPGREDKLRYQSIFWVKPQDIGGTSFLNVWPYDQRQFPDLWGYIPAFKRVRRFPTNQRFEPLIAGNTLYLSDAWAAGDPFMTWGNFKIVGRGPYLAAVSGNWNGQNSNWEHTTHGGKKDQTFWDTEVELVPEVIVVEAEPIKFPRAPVSRKRVWFDARTLSPIGMVTFDRRGQVFKSFDGAYSTYEDGTNKFMDGEHPYWSWTRVHAFDVQTNRMTRLEQVKEVSGGYKTEVNNPDHYNQYLTLSAIRRLGH